MVGEEEVTKSGEYNDLRESEGADGPLTHKRNLTRRPHHDDEKTLARCGLSQARRNAQRDRQLELRQMARLELWRLRGQAARQARQLRHFPPALRRLSDDWRDQAAAAWLAGYDGGIGKATP